MKIFFSAIFFLYLFLNTLNIFNLAYAVESSTEAVKKTAVTEKKEKNYTCGRGKIRYKIEPKYFDLNVDICRNNLGQFFTEKCIDGCEFRTELMKYYQIKAKDVSLGSPGGQRCRIMGFKSYTSEIEYAEKKYLNVELCFGEHPTALISTAYLYDLQIKPEPPKKKKSADDEEESE